MLSLQTLNLLFHPPSKAVNMIIYAACPIHTAFAIQSKVVEFYDNKGQFTWFPGLKLHSWKTPNTECRIPNAPTKGLLKYMLHIYPYIPGMVESELQEKNKGRDRVKSVKVA